MNYYPLFRVRLWNNGMRCMSFDILMEFAIYLNQKQSDCHKMKSKHIDWTLGLKSDHWVWPWSWPWPWIYKVKRGICYISAKKWSDCHEMKSKHIEWPLGLTLVMTLTLNLQGQIWNLLYAYTLGQNDPIATKQNKNECMDWTKVRCKDLLDSDQGDFRCRCPVDLSSIILALNASSRVSKSFVLYVLCTEAKVYCPS